MNQPMTAAGGSRDMADSICSPHRLADRGVGRRARGSGSGASSSSCPMGRGGLRRRAGASRRREIHIHDRRGPRQAAPRRRDRRRRGLHGRPVVQPGPGRRSCAGRRSTGSSLALSTGWFRVPLQLRRTIAHRLRRNTTRQSRRNIAAHYDLGNDFYRTLPGRDDDLLERRLRHAGPVARRRPAQQVPAHGGGRRADPRPARPRDRDGLGRVRAVRGRRARLPGDDDHDLAGAARPGPRARPGRRPGGPRRRPAARLPRHRPAPTTRSSRSRCSRRSARSTSRRFFEICDRRARARRAAQPPVDHLPGRRLRAGSSAARTGSRRTSSRAACARPWPSSSGPPATRACWSGA